jgi:hypothetical protein
MLDNLGHVFSGDSVHRSPSSCSSLSSFASASDSALASELTLSWSCNSSANKLLLSGTICEGIFHVAVPLPFSISASATDPLGKKPVSVSCARTGLCCGVLAFLVPPRSGTDFGRDDCHDSSLQRILDDLLRSLRCIPGLVMEMGVWCFQVLGQSSPWSWTGISSTGVRILDLKSHPRLVRYVLPSWNQDLSLRLWRPSDALPFWQAS